MMMRERDKKIEPMPNNGLVDVLIAVDEAIVCVRHAPISESRSLAHGELVVNLSETEHVKQ
jgi:hypothetical protein